MYEVSNELVEVREEAELLRLQMEVAQQEEEAARSALAAAQAALAAALAGPDEPSESDPAQVRSLLFTAGSFPGDNANACLTLAINTASSPAIKPCRSVCFIEAHPSRCA